MGNILSSKLGDGENVARQETYFTYDGITPRVTTVRNNDIQSGGALSVVRRPRTDAIVGYHTVTHDAAGNETAYIARRGYSERNLLAFVAEAGEEGSPEHRLSFEYDGRGIRVARHEAWGWLAETTRSVYSPELQTPGADPLGLFEIRRTWDFRRTDPGTRGSSGFRLDRLDYDCNEASTGCWRLRFTLYPEFTMEYDDQGTYDHEWRHLQILESYLFPTLARYFGPPERRFYRTFSECREAALTTQRRFIDDYNPWQGRWRHLLHDLSDPGYH